MDMLSRLPSGFWDWLRRAPERLLLLDYEGVIAPAHIDRDQALPHPRLYALLRKLCQVPATHVAVLSSWPVRDLVRFLPGLSIDLIGESGWEMRTRAGTLIEYPIPEAQARALAAAVAEVRALGLAAALEVRRGSVALETHGLSLASTPEVERRCLAVWQTFAQRGDLRLSRVVGRLELTAAGRDPGLAVRELTSAAPLATASVYLCGDATDDGTLRAAQSCGFGLCLDEVQDLTRGVDDRFEDVGVFLRCWLVSTSPAKEVGA